MSFCVIQTLSQSRTCGATRWLRTCCFASSAPRHVYYDAMPASRDGSLLTFVRIVACPPGAYFRIVACIVVASAKLHGLVAPMSGAFGMHITSGPRGMRSAWLRAPFQHICPTHRLRSCNVCCWLQDIGTCSWAEKRQSMCSLARLWRLLARHLQAHTFGGHTWACCRRLANLSLLTF